MLVLRARTTDAPSLAVCSPQLKQCFAYLTEDSYVASYPMSIDATIAPEAALALYLQYLNSRPDPFKSRTLKYEDFDVAIGKHLLRERSIPKGLQGEPDDRLIQEAKQTWERTLRPDLPCPASMATNNHLLARIFLFARRPADQTEWFVARLCQYSGGGSVESVQRLFRDDLGGWQATSSGYMGTAEENAQVKHVLTSIRKVLLLELRD